MKTILFNILPDYENTYITTSAAYNFFVDHITRYLQEQGPSCTIYIDIGKYTFKEIGEDNSYSIHINTDDSQPYIHIGVSAESTSEVEDKIKFFISKSEVCLFEKATIFEKDVFASDECEDIMNLASSFTTITVKDCLDKRYILAHKSDVFTKTPQSNANYTEDENGPF
jgi:hypothetical protein